MSSTELPRIVIVGAGFGGLTTARELGRADARVTVIDRTNHHLFQPLLYQVAAAALNPSHIAAAIRQVLHGQRNTEVLMAEVAGIDPEKQVVLTDRMDVPYDYLVLAMGSLYNYFGRDEWEKDAPSLKTLADALNIRQRILTAFEEAEIETDPARRAALLTFVLVGGGPTGVEMAGTLAELSKMALRRDFRSIRPEEARILLVEAGPRILTAFPEKLSAAAQRALERLGVDVRTGAPVECVDADGVVIGGERISSRNVLWTAGVVATPAGKWLGAPVDKIGRVLVQPDLSVPDRPNVFVIGDAAHVQQDGKPLPGVAPVAMQQGRYVGRLIRKALTPQPPLPERRERGSNTPPFHYIDKGNLATIGRGYAILDLGWLKISGFLAWILWIFIHIWYLIGFRNRISVLLQWAWAYFTFQRVARIIYAEKTPADPQPSPDSSSCVEETESCIPR